jgi:hypothetical protein
MTCLMLVEQLTRNIVLMLTPLQYFGPTATLKTVLKCECDNGDHEYLRNMNEFTRQCYKPY